MAEGPIEEQPEKPRFEPEILPPRSDEWARWDGQRIHVVRLSGLSPFRLAAWALGFLFILVSLLFLAAGALLVVLPVIAAIFVVAFLAARLRAWLGAGRNQ